MASTAALAKRRGLAFERFNRVRDRFNSHYELELPEITPSAKDPEMRLVEEMELLSDMLERIADAAGVEGGEEESAPAGEDGQAAEGPSGDGPEEPETETDEADSVSAPKESDAAKSKPASRKKLLRKKAR